MKKTAAQEITDEMRIDLIRTTRNNLIKFLLADTNIVAYFAQQYDRKELNNVRIEFIKKELRDLLIAPVDLVHYSSLILQMKHEGTMSVTEKDIPLFHQELGNILRKYTT